MSLETPSGSPDKETPTRPENSCLARQLQLRQELARSQDRQPRGYAITISHLAGAGAHEVADELAVLLQRGEPPEARPWTLYDRHLLEKMLKDNDLPRTLAEFLGENSHSYLQDAVDDLIGVIPPSWDVIPKFRETVLKLVEAGHVILVGRGASFITASLPHVFHVFLIASTPTRIKRLRLLKALTQADAAEEVAIADGIRQQFVADHFGSPLEESLSYNLTINTDRVDPKDCVVLIALAAEAFWRRQPQGIL